MASGNETAFLTKSGDLGMVLTIPGLDYETLDRSGQEYAVKRLEAALETRAPCHADFRTAIGNSSSLPGSFGGNHFETLRKLCGI
jgi:hypothetical protein